MDSCERLRRTVRVRAYLPVLAERFAGVRLEALGHLGVRRGLSDQSGDPVSGLAGTRSGGASARRGAPYSR
ncbi:hypothetical protein ABZ806_23395 [Spirillospora sp. NPDC047418]